MDGNVMTEDRISDGHGKLLVKLKHLFLLERLTMRVLEMGNDIQDPVFRYIDHETSVEVLFILEQAYKSQIREAGND
jgi:hypothetical protein